MPFTLAHGAAALPFRRSRLVGSAVLVGTFAPDFEYFLRLRPGGTFGHTPLGLLIFTLPASLVFLWMFHAFIKLPAVALLPDGWRRRLVPHLREFRFGGAARFGLIIVSVLIGAVTHVIWDQFTHTGTWPCKYLPVLRHSVPLPIIGPRALATALQLVSTLVGVAILAIWLAHWYRTTIPARENPGDTIPAQRRVAIVLVMTGFALALAALRAVHRWGFSVDHLLSKDYVEQFVITFIAMLWWELVAYALCSQPFILRAERSD